MYFNIGMKTIDLEVFQQGFGFPPITTRKGKIAWYCLGPVYWILAFLVAGDGSRRLVAFDRVAAAPHRRATARLSFSAPAGSYKLVVGDLSRPIRVG